jgi:hypothetical protein
MGYEPGGNSLLQKAQGISSEEKTREEYGMGRLL